MVVEAAGYCALCAREGRMTAVDAYRVTDPVGVYAGQTAHETHSVYECPLHGRLTADKVLSADEAAAEMDALEVGYRE
jgi:hypothetical protein